MRIMHITLSLIFLSLAQMTLANTIHYVVEGFDEAKERAQQEGKMLLVDFHANWCVPCEWMEQTTFADARVIKQMNEDFITVKVNIDDFDGYALKERFDINVLPTVIIVDNDGKVVERVEETISPSKMNVVLERNKTNYTRPLHHTNTSPEDISYKLSEDNNYSKAIYKLQLGTFTSYSKTLKFYQDVTKQIDDQIIILHDFKGDNMIYRVLLGNFNNTIEAEIYKTDLLENHNITSHLFY